MENSIQFIGVNPTEFKNLVIDGVKEHLKVFEKNFQPKELPEYLTRQETADFFKVGLVSIHNWTKSGKLIAYKVAQKVYYKRTEVEAAMTRVSQQKRAEV